MWMGLGRGGGKFERMGLLDGSLGRRDSVFERIVGIGLRGCRLGRAWWSQERRI